MDPSIRFLAPREHDRVADLLRKSPCDIRRLTPQLQVIKILKNAMKYIEILEKIEKLVAKNAGFNFILRNIPDVGELSSNGKQEQIGYVHMRDTMQQFGQVDALEIIRSTVYVKFDNPHPCHSLVNNMMMGTNIINSIVI